MHDYSHIELLSHGPVSVARLRNCGMPRRTDPQYRQEIAALEKELNRTAENPDCQILIVDCSPVTVFGSDMLSKLIMLQRRLKHTRRRLVLCGLNPDVRRVLHWTKLDQFFEINENASPLVTSLCESPQSATALDFSQADGSEL